MIATERQSRNDGVGGTAWQDGAGGEGISHDAIIDLGVDRALEDADAGAACSASLDGFAKALGHTSFSGTTFVLQGYEETARGRRVVAVVLARPGVDVKHAAGRGYHVAGVSDAVGEDRGAKSGG